MHINENHQLVIDEGEDFKIGKDLITPHPQNFDSIPTHRISGPEYIIMHYTGGMVMESTINAFKNPPKDPDSGASAHLLIGRDGSVVQFLRFDQIAYHAGYSWWEQQTDLNRCSIGIEFDNLGQLFRKDNKWQPRHQDKISVPEEEVQQHEYWKLSLPAGNRDDPEYRSKLPSFQKFTDAQLAVALPIIRALIQKYPSIKEILGHGQINIAQRDDPGPLLPIQAWRMELFGREDPLIDEYIINQPTDLYMNINGNLPNTDQTTFDKPLPANSQVRVLSWDEIGGLVKAAVIKSTVKGTGWIRSNKLEALPTRSSKPDKKRDAKANDQRITTITQSFFKASDCAPTLKVNQGFESVNRGLVFQAGTRVRIQEFRGGWALVALLDRIGGDGKPDNEHGQGGLEGWIRKEFLSRKEV